MFYSLKNELIMLFHAYIITSREVEKTDLKLLCRFPKLAQT